MLSVEEYSDLPYLSPVLDRVLKFRAQCDSVSQVSRVPGLLIQPQV